MYLFQRQGKEYKVIDKEWTHVRDQLVKHENKWWISIFDG